MTLLDVAFKWLDFGVSPIPLMFKSKRPLIKWSEYQNRTPHASEVETWFGADNLNLGVVCGCEANLVVLDFDNLKSYYTVVSSLPRTAQSVISNTYRVMTSRGIHVYLTTDEWVRTSRYPSISLDMKAQGGYVVAPPSIHPDGSQYIPLGEEVLHVCSVRELLGSYMGTDTVKVFVDQAPINPVGQIAKEELKNSSSFFEKLYILKKYMNVLDIANMFTEMCCVSPDGRWWYGRCPHPDHNDRHPSFRVDLAAGLCRCLSNCPLNTIRGLDLLDLYCKITGMKNTDALNVLIAPFIA